MQVRLTDAMLNAITQQVHEARSTRGILDVYKAAEIIRLENIADNVAREDIIEKLVHLSGLAFVPIEFNKRSFEAEGAYCEVPDSPKNSLFADTSLKNESVH